jgi:hypothetical protein
MPQNPPLLRLPAEIRNKIYAYVFASTTYTMEPRNRTNSYMASDRSDECDRKHHYLALSLVCRQLHFETKALPLLLGTVKSTSIWPLIDTMNQNNSGHYGEGPPKDNIVYLHLQTYSALLWDIMYRIKPIHANFKAV